MAAITFERATIAVGGAPVLTDVSLDVADGDFLGVIGPSGSGKSTLLRAVAGFADIVAGRVLIGGEDMRDVHARHRDVGMVFQDPVLFRKRSVERNVAFPLELRGHHAAEIRERVGAEVRAMHVEHLLRRAPDTLSRGEAQLVQVARAMVRTPRVLLLDEPLAALDGALRARIRAELRLLQEGYGVTTLLATNDPDDALHLPRRLAVIDGGRVVQVAPTAEVRRVPATLSAALATGDSSTLTVRVVADQQGFWLDGESGSFRRRAWSPVLADWIGADVTLMIRPDDVAIGPAGSIDAAVVRTVPGQPATLICRIGDRTISVHEHHPTVDAGDRVRLRLDHGVVFDPAGSLITAI